MAMTTQTETLTQFAARRLPELDREIEDLRSVLSEVEAEKKYLLDFIALRMRGEPSGTPRLSPHNNSRAVAAERTIQDAVVETIKAAGRAMTAIEILPIINASLGVDYPRSSLSPQLSRLKSKGVLSLRGKGWSLAEWDARHWDDDSQLQNSLELQGEKENPGGDTPGPINMLD